MDRASSAANYRPLNHRSIGRGQDHSPSPFLSADGWPGRCYASVTAPGSGILAGCCQLGLLGQASHD